MYFKRLKKRIIAISLVCVIIALSGCNQISDKNTDLPQDEIKEISPSVSGIENDNPEGEPFEKKITDFTMFVDYPGEEIYENNEIRELIVQKTGVRVEEKWKTDKTKPGQEVSKILESGELPDFIDASDYMSELYEAGVLVPWDEYLEKYPNLMELFTDDEWDLFRQEDGHIYWANVFGNKYGEDQTKVHIEEAFWIQVRVLEYFDYPEISTLNDYFEILEKYYEENKTFVNSKGEEVDIIPYTALCDDWRYFCIENAPNFLDGYMNDGTISVDTKNYDVPTILSYDNTPTARRYLEKLNEAYNKGLMDKDFDIRTYDGYMDLIRSGAVLGMCDQFWDFGYGLSENAADQKLCERGCEYVPLGLTIDEGMSQCWHLYGDEINQYTGIAVTTSCENPELAFSFLNALLEQEIHDLRFWGIEGVDYLVDDEGLYYRTPQMREKCSDEEYKKSHFCQYSYMPQWLGTSRDNKNAMQPQEQKTEYLATLSDSLAKCFEAYNVGGYVEMLGSEKVEIPVWFPMYSYTSSMGGETPGRLAHVNIESCKHEWLPKVVKSDNFEEAWNAYMEAYDACKPEDYIEAMQEDLNGRIEKAAENK